MIKNILIAVLLIVLLGAIFMIRNRSPFGKNQTSFAIAPDREITRIELSQDGKKLVLERTDKTWKVDRKNEARSSGISLILNVLTEMKIKSPVSADLFTREVTGMNLIPVRVKVFENRRLLKSFYVFKTRSNIYGNIMKLKPNAKPFIVSIPGFESDIGSVFNPDQLFWQPYIVFNLLPSEISSVTFEDLREPDLSFKIFYSADQFKLSDPDSALTGWDSLRVKRYLSYFTMVPFENWASDLGYEEELKIKNGTPLYRISVAKPDGNEITLTLWEKILEATGTRDSDRLWGKTNNRG